MEGKEEQSGGQRGGTVPERIPWSPIQGGGRLVRGAGRRGSRASTAGVHLRLRADPDPGL